MGRDADTKEQLEQSVEIIVTGENKIMGQIGMKKRPSKIKPQTGTVGAKRRQALSVLSVTNPCQSVPFPVSNSPNFGPQFLRRKYGNLRNFYVEIAFGYCREIGIVRPIRRTDPFIAFVNSHCTQNRGYSDTFFDCFWFCLIDTVKLAAWKQVSEGETRG